MQQEILGEDEDFQMIVDNTPQNPDDIFFNQVVQALQQIIVHQQFQKSQAGFMRSHCQSFQPVQQNKIQYITIFNQYQQTISTCLEKMLIQRIPSFNMSRFVAMLPNKMNQISEEIYQILTSFTDFEVFKTLMLDYKADLQQQNRLKLLTIKTNKIPQNKKIKGSNDNIFNNSKQPTFNNELVSKKKSSNSNQKKQKNESQILLPDLILTIKPLKKK